MSSLTRSNERTPATSRVYDVVGTTVNGGQPVHGKCSPSDGALVDARGFFECAKYVALPPSADGTYTFVTTATPAVDEDAYEGSFVGGKRHGRGMYTNVRCEQKV